ncbi:hypothetical protein I302_103556 [Kwoniella bestiolae CBS 10118]|uniref:UDP-glycosyltransferases domain-containing protein n=1 Tax=Kwoniella bestiolae CBS 10118 TaxID=1296100 RepID=A0A1B9G8R7_9TREE|nr:hypothetical protein I302_02258 [Kwoniella bestiolae CBS 10118]OCF27416.1 hypothetical protein I302_02258 [Kwoniella bestiolae CBS 10118]
MQASKVLQEVDKELYDWCSNRPTVFICLGSNMVYSQENAQEMLNSICTILGIRQDIQVLWKLKKTGDYKLDGIETMGDRLRVVDWLEADPSAILRGGNVVCFVSHGGSNSYHEALYAGVPQVIMPAWVDCYDFAARLEYFGIGVWGNPMASPDCLESELTNALLRVIGRTPDDTQAVLMRNRAQALGRLVSKDYTQEGRDIAAGHIWGEMQKVKAERLLQF